MVVSPSRLTHSITTFPRESSPSTASSSAAPPPHAPSALFQGGERGGAVTNFDSLPSVVTWSTPQLATGAVRNRAATELRNRLSCDASSPGGTPLHRGGWMNSDCLVFQILSLLPPASRLRCRRVSRDWKRSVDDPLVWERVSFPPRIGPSSGDPPDGESEAEVRWGEAWAAGLERLARRCFSATRVLELPSMSAAVLEAVLLCAPMLRSLVVRGSGCTGRARLDENALVSVPDHMDSDERYHRSSLRAVCRANPNLRTLDFSCQPPGSWVAVHRLVDALHHAANLQELLLANCINVDDRIVNPLMKRAMRRVDVRGTSVTAVALARLAE
ncbi:hypothetical protein T484DRAFT_1974488, partial [Baffinella frigidus]